MKKCISFSLFGNDPIYTAGILQNINYKNIFYPDYDICLYYDNTVSSKYLNFIEEEVHFNFVENSNTNKIPGYFWRFFVLDNPEYDLILLRDADSRLSKREKLAVENWLNTGCALHVMRDHPHHNYKMMAGMWGIKGERNFCIYEMIKYFFEEQPSLKHIKISDQIFLENIFDMHENNRIVHDNWNRFGECLKFPHKRVKKEFVGEIFGENDFPKYNYCDLTFL
jgi:hypothetical protein